MCRRIRGCSEITVATLNYDSAKYLTSVKDGAGRTYTLGYKDKKLVSISRMGRCWRSMACARRTPHHRTRGCGMCDAEAHYGVQFQYKDGQVRWVQEITEATSYTSTAQTGALIEMNHRVKGQTKYRDYGNDRRYNTSDDLLTYYTF